MELDLKNAFRPQFKASVLVIDDHAALCDGLARMLNASDLPLQAVHTARNSHQALAVAATVSPAVVLLDVDLDGEDGLLLLPALAPNSAVLVLTSHTDQLTITRALSNGARGVLDKRLPGKQVIEAIRHLLNFHQNRQPHPVNAGVPA